MKDCFKNIPCLQTPPLLSYHRCTSLKDRLVKNDVPIERTGKLIFLGTSRKGSYPCLNCVNCKLMVKGEEFVHPESGARFKLKYNLTWLSDWVVYIIWYPCKLIYVGETTHDLKTRLNQHHYTVRMKHLDLPVSKHCVEAGHSKWDLRCMVVDYIPPLSRAGDRSKRLLKK